MTYMFGGCPAYLLEKAIADGKKLPRWKPRSVCCINMGLSEKHAITVFLVLNLETGYITPQYHIVFDDWFATAATNADALPDFTQHVGPNCLAIQDINSHLMKATITMTKLQRKPEWTPKLPTPSTKSKQELPPPWIKQSKSTNFQSHLRPKLSRRHH